MFKILVTSRNFGAVHPTDFDYFLDRGWKIVENPYTGSILTETQLLGIIEGADALLVGGEQVTAKVIDAASRLKVIAKAGIGVDNIDIRAASAKGIAVVNVPGTTADSVAELTLGMMLSVSKLIMYNNRRVMQGMWPMDRGWDLCGRTLGIVGFGRIGQAVAKLASGFGMKMMAYSPHFNEEAAKRLNVTRATVDEITEQCRYITIHAPKKPETENLFDAGRIARMQPGSYLFNLARGGIVNEDALYDALQSGHLAGAGFDVLAEEPPKTRPKLFDCENFLINSHTGGNSMDCIALTARVAAENIIAVLEGMPCPNTVNAKELGK